MQQHVHYLSGLKNDRGGVHLAIVVYLAQDIKANTKLEDNFEHPSGPFLYA